MSYAPYLTALGIDADGWHPSVVEQLGKEAADAVTNTAKALAMKERSQGQPLVVTAEHYLQALLSLDDGERARLRERILDKA